MVGTNGGTNLAQNGQHGAALTMLLRCQGPGQPFPLQPLTEAQRRSSGCSQSGWGQPLRQPRRREYGRATMIGQNGENPVFHAEQPFPHAQLLKERQRQQPQGLGTNSAATVDERDRRSSRPKIPGQPERPREIKTQILWTNEHHREGRRTGFILSYPVVAVARVGQNANVRLGGVSMGWDQPRWAVFEAICQ